MERLCGGLEYGPRAEFFSIRTNVGRQITCLPFFCGKLVNKHVCVQLSYTLFFNKNVVFPAQPEYSYFSADFRLKIFLYYS